MLISPPRTTFLVPCALPDSWRDCDRNGGRLGAQTCLLFSGPIRTLEGERSLRRFDTKHTYTLQIHRSNKHFNGDLGGFTLTSGVYGSMNIITLEITVVIPLKKLTY